MRTLAIATTIFAALAAGSAIAADMPLKAPAPAAPMQSWTGFYINGGWGYGMWSADTTTINTTTGVCSLCVETRQGGRGWLGTVGGGFDFQVGGRWVLGVFGDFDFASIKGNIQDQGPYAVAEAKLDEAWAVGGRLGYLITPALLSYVNGGYTGARFKSGVEVNNNNSGLPFSPSRSYQGFTTSGWFFGGGAEWQLAGIGPFGRGWYWRNEYRLAEYDAKDFVSCTVSGCGTANSAGNSIHFKPWVQTFRSELVWKFNWGAPVVANY